MADLEQLGFVLLLGQAEAPGKGDMLTNLLTNPLPMMLIVGVLFYMLLMRPDAKKRKEAESMLSNLKKNDQVVTIGGICGTVVNATPGASVVTIRVDDGNNTRLRILRSAISRVGAPDDGEAPAALDSK